MLCVAAVAGPNQDGCCGADGILPVLRNPIRSVAVGMLDEPADKADALRFQRRALVAGAEDASCQRTALMRAAQATAVTGLTVRGLRRDREPDPASSMASASLRKKAETFSLLPAK